MSWLSTRGITARRSLAPKPTRKDAVMKARIQDSIGTSSPRWTCRSPRAPCHTPAKRRARPGTLGYSWRDWQIEGSWFNGREPDEHRWDFDLDDLDSYSGRLTWNFSPNWSAQISHAFLDSPEELHPEDDVHRTTVSLTHVWSDERESHLASTLAWGVNRAHGENSHAVLLEANWRTAGRWNVFGRAEYVEKSGEELTIEPAETEFDLKQLNLGVSHELVSGRSWELALGGSVSYTFAPSELDSLYGENPVGWWIFLRLRPAAMAAEH